MGTDEAPEGARRAGLETAARTVLVVALLAVTASALSARRHLDWDRLTSPPGGTATRLLLGTLGLAVLLVTARRLLRLMRRDRQPLFDTDDDEEAPRWGRWPLIVLATALALAGAALVGLALGPLLDGGPRRREDPADAAGGSDAFTVGNGGWAVLAAVVAALVVAAGLVRLSRHAQAPTVFDRVEQPGSTADPDAALLLEAVADAEATLAANDDTRAAIIAAYAAMERSLDQGLRRRGQPHPESDTPTELLERVVAAGLVSRGAAADLTELFREARFSNHPMPPATRTTAEAALARVGSELAARRG